MQGARLTPLAVSASRRTILVAIAAIAATSCLSPTLPLPPPSDPKQSDIDETTGTLHLTGHVRPTSWIYALNLETYKGYIQITGADGRYDLTVAASHGDRFSLWYDYRGDQSDSLEITIK
ncbi:MAG TPA: hypothetical protein VFQ35_12070 [Polyangiaceae bacterium]|nr:hypothetical protein [Polyangiaceae bacterium]